MADLSDPRLVAREYASLERLEARRLDRTAWLRGVDELLMLLSAIAEARPHRVLDAGCGGGDPQVTQCYLERLRPMLLGA